MKEKLKDFQQMTENSTPDFHSSLKEIETGFLQQHTCRRHSRAAAIVQVTGVGVKISTSQVQLNTTLQQAKYTLSKCTEAIIKMWVGAKQALHL